MPLTRPQAEDAARMICGLRPDYPRAPVTTMLTSDKLIGYTTAQILSAAFDLTTNPQAKTIQALPTHLERLYGTWGKRAETTNPLQSKVMVEPHGQRYQPVTRRESCEIHEGGLKGHCAGCRADALAVVSSTGDG